MKKLTAGVLCLSFLLFPLMGRREYFSFGLTYLAPPSSFHQTLKEQDLISFVLEYLDIPIEQAPHFDLRQAYYALYYHLSQLFLFPEGQDKKVTFKEERLSRLLRYFPSQFFASDMELYRWAQILVAPPHRFEFQLVALEGKLRYFSWDTTVRRNIAAALSQHRPRWFEDCAKFLERDILDEEGTPQNVRKEVENFFKKWGWIAIDSKTGIAASRLKRRIPVLPASAPSWQRELFIELKRYALDNVDLDDPLIAYFLMLPFESFQKSLVHAGVSTPKQYLEALPYFIFYNEVFPLLLELGKSGYFDQKPLLVISHLIQIFILQGELEAMPAFITTDTKMQWWNALYMLFKVFFKSEPEFFKNWWGQLSSGMQVPQGNPNSVLREQMGEAFKRFQQSGVHRHAPKFQNPLALLSPTYGQIRIHLDALRPLVVKELSQEDKISQTISLLEMAESYFEVLQEEKKEVKERLKPTGSPFPPAFEKFLYILQSQGIKKILASLRGTQNHNLSLQAGLPLFLDPPLNAAQANKLIHQEIGKPDLLHTGIASPRGLPFMAIPNISEIRIDLTVLVEWVTQESYLQQVLQEIEKALRHGYSPRSTQVRVDFRLEMLSHILKAAPSSYLTSDTTLLWIWHCLSSSPKKSQAWLENLDVEVRENLLEILNTHCADWFSRALDLLESPSLEMVPPTPYPRDTVLRFLYRTGWVIPGMEAQISKADLSAGIPQVPPEAEAWKKALYVQLKQYVFKRAGNRDKLSTYLWSLTYEKFEQSLKRLQAPDAKTYFEQLPNLIFEQTALHMLEALLHEYGDKNPLLIVENLFIHLFSVSELSQKKSELVLVWHMTFSLITQYFAGDQDKLSGFWRKLCRAMSTTENRDKMLFLWKEKHRKAFEKFKSQLKPNTRKGSAISLPKVSVPKKCRPIADVCDSIQALFLVDSSL